MKRVILALVFSGLVGSPALAQAPLVTHWDSGQLVNTLQALGASDIRVGELSGKPALTAKTRDGLSVALYAKSCDVAAAPAPPVCHGIEGVINYDAGKRPDLEGLIEQLNHNFAMGKFMGEADGAIRGTRYFLLDGGVTEDNLRTELNDYFTVGQLASQAIWPQSAAK